MPRPGIRKVPLNNALQPTLWVALVIRPWHSPVSSSRSNLAFNSDALKRAA